MIDHIVLTVRDLARSVAFYERTLAPLGFTNFIDYPGRAGHARLCGLGNARESYIMLREGTPAPHAVHFALAARTRKQVDAFHAAAIAAGGRDNGPPGERLHYFAGYYAAYAHDPDGYNIEAMHQRRAM